MRQLARYCESELALYPPPALTRVEQAPAATGDRPARCAWVSSGADDPALAVDICREACALEADGGEGASISSQTSAE